jgi:UTP--glucose-1-phosphate uridylyltransferase
MEIKRAVITAAGRHQSTLPLQTLVDRHGQARTALAILLEEIAQAGISEVAVVVPPGAQSAFTAAAGSDGRRLTFVEQTEPLGYGHAVWCARSFTSNQPFLLLVGDHLYVSGQTKSCAQQLVEIAAAENCSVSAVQPTHESKLPYYGAVGGRRVAGRRELYEITEVLEKPTPTEAEQRLIVPGLRAVMELLDALVQKGQPPVQLSAALAQLPGRERYLAAELAGRRYDIGVKYGLLTAQLALAMEGQDREEVLALVVELLAQRNRRGGAT